MSETDKLLQPTKQRSLFYKARRAIALNVPKYNDFEYRLQEFLIQHPQVTTVIPIACLAYSGAKFVDACVRHKKDDMLAYGNIMTISMELLRAGAQVSKQLEMRKKARATPLSESEQERIRQAIGEYLKQHPQSGEGTSS